MLDVKPLFTFYAFGYKCILTEMVVIQWVIILIGLILSILLTRNLKRLPDKKQSALEMFVEVINNLVIENMGEENKSFIPYIGSVILFMIAMNLTGLFGFKPPTQNYSVALGMALTSFLVIQGAAIKKNGVGHYLVPLLNPLNILERVTLPVSLSLRLFGNMFAATVTMELAYSALGGLPIFHGIKQIAWLGQLVLPIPLHAYFDLFDGSVQMLIFTMLTMINIKVTSEH